MVNVFKEVHKRYEDADLIMKFEFFYYSLNYMEHARIFSIFSIAHILKIKFFIIPWPIVPLLLPAQKCECDIFVQGMVKNSIRSTGVKLTSSTPLMFASGRKSS